LKGYYQIKLVVVPLFFFFFLSILAFKRKSQNGNHPLEDVEEMANRH
jgi:hypothetical protein